MLFKDILSRQEEGNLLSFEDKMVGYIGEFLGAKDGKNNRKVGLMLMAAAGVFLTLGNVLVQFIYEKTIGISSFEVLFARSLIQLVFCIFFWLFGKFICMVKVNRISFYCVQWD